ncbi:MAG: hypothetical protein DYH12_06400 [Sorangiineae bacterium PRO1]|nr:hypothetical protein [Sorangiineae bacterium PRO1]
MKATGVAPKMASSALEQVGVPSSRVWSPRSPHHAGTFRQFGVLSSHSSRRQLVVPKPPPDCPRMSPRPLAATSSSCSASMTSLGR